MLILRHPSSLLHDTGRHPERASRIEAINAALDARDWLGADVRESPEVSLDVLRTVHPAEHIERVRTLAAEGGGRMDPDTVVSPASWEAALHAAGGAVAIVDALVGGETRAAASLHRPPGHHAETARAMGFCLFNNIAVAAEHALDAHGLERVAIVDFDVHHGNGTNDIFHAEPRVLFCSMHQWPLYPGTGGFDDRGSGAGTGTTVNLPMAPGTGDAEWCSVIEHVVVPIVARFAPQLVLLSAGYDAHAHDPLGECEVSDAGYRTISASLRRVADSVGAPVGVVLEGGYDVDALARSLIETLDVVGADETPAAEAIAVSPEAETFNERLGAGVG